MPCKKELITTFAAMKLRIALLAIAIVSCTNARAAWVGNEKLDDALRLTPWIAAATMKACGMESRHDWPALVATAAASGALSAGITYTLKATIDEPRPDGSDNRSFPSGHATIAFAGATVLHKEFGRVSPWISVAGYSVATFTAVDRVLADRHHWYDVAAGAAIGVLSAELCYYVSGKIFKDKGVSVAFNGSGFDVAINIR